MSAAVWVRPMAARVPSSMVWGLMLTRFAPRARMTASFSGVMVSGRPASTVYSARLPAGKQSPTRAISVSSWSASSTVGVPPPM